MLDDDTLLRMIQSADSTQTQTHTTQTQTHTTQTQTHTTQTHDGCDDDATDTNTPDIAALSHVPITTTTTNNNNNNTTQQQKSLQRPTRATRATRASRPTRATLRAAAAATASNPPCTSTNSPTTQQLNQPHDAACNGDHQQQQQQLQQGDVRVQHTHPHAGGLPVWSANGALHGGDDGAGTVQYPVRGDGGGWSVGGARWWGGVRGRDRHEHGQKAVNGGENMVNIWDVIIELPDCAR